MPSEALELRQSELAARVAETARRLWHLRWRKSAAIHRRIAGKFDLCLVNSQEDLDNLRAISSACRRIEFVPNRLNQADGVGVL